MKHRTDTEGTAKNSTSWRASDPLKTIVYVKDGIEFRCGFGMLESCGRGCRFDPAMCSRVNRKQGGD